MGWGGSGGAQQRERQTQPGLGAESQLNSSSANLIAEIPQEPSYLLKIDVAEDPHLSGTAPEVPQAQQGLAHKT